MLRVLAVPLAVGWSRRAAISKRAAGSGAREMAAGPGALAFRQLRDVAAAQEALIERLLRRERGGAGRAEQHEVLARRLAVSAGGRTGPAEPPCPRGRGGDGAGGAGSGASRDWEGPAEQRLPRTWLVCACPTGRLLQCEVSPSSHGKLGLEGTSGGHL